MARKASKLVLEMNKRRQDLLTHTQECIDRIAKGIELPAWHCKEPEKYISRMEGYDTAFEDLLRSSKCYRGYNYLDKNLQPLIWHPNYEKIQDHPEFAEWRRVYYV